MFIANLAKEKKMSAYRFTALPSHSSVVGAVTLLVSAWFLVAAGALVTDSHSDQLLDEIRLQRDASLPYDTYTTIVVEARRGPERS